MPDQEMEGPDLPSGKPGPELGSDVDEHSTRMPPRQLAVLFGFSLIIWTLGNGILPLLPLVAKGLGAASSIVGLYLALAYLSIATGSLAAGWLADRFRRRKTLMLLVAILAPPVVAATSRVTDVVQLTILTCVVWWLGGMALALTSILAGLSAGAAERGKILGTLALAAPAGSVLGGFSVGAIADIFGYSTMWIVLGLLWLVAILPGLAVREVSNRGQPAARPAVGSGWGLSRPFLLLLVCSVLAAVGSFIGALGRSFAMGDLGFSNLDITSTVAVSGLATLPFPRLLGTLSDRLGRVRFVALCYGAGIAGLVVYAGASSLWGFWIASSLLAFVAYVSPGVGSALVVDLVDRPSLGRGMALFGATGWTGGILGFAIGGFAFDRLGNTDAFLFGAVLAVFALIVLMPVARSVRLRANPRTLQERSHQATRKE
ncbi:MAG TPA: MFS transporter [Thermoplasmata archaeon]